MILGKHCRLDENPRPLEMHDLPVPVPLGDEILVKVSACGVCHTELDEIEGRTPPPQLPVIPGHQIVGRVVKTATTGVYGIGDRVGIAWINSACGKCDLCLAGFENLCSSFKATGRDVDGGYAEYALVRSAFAYRIPEIFSDTEAAPLLCAGAIGYRSLRLANITDGKKLGLTGFGASAHLVLKMVRYRYPHTKVYVFARSEKERAFAKSLGAAWTGDTGEESPETLDAIIDTTPIWRPIVEALRNLSPGGRLLINAIRKEDGDKAQLMRLDYTTHLWSEKEVKSVANVSRSDVTEFLTLAAAIPIKPEFQVFPLEKANEALFELKTQNIRGAKVLTINS